MKAKSLWSFDLNRGYLKFGEVAERVTYWQRRDSRQHSIYVPGIINFGVTAFGSEDEEMAVDANTAAHMLRAGRKCNLFFGGQTAVDGHRTVAHCIRNPVAVRLTVY